MSEPGLDYSQRVQEESSMQSLVGEKLQYEPPLEQGKIITTTNGTKLSFEKKWTRGSTDWVALDAKWIVRTNSHRKVISVEAT